MNASTLRKGTNEGIQQCRPHGETNDIADMCWNHNGQVMATCSDADEVFCSKKGGDHDDIINNNNNNNNTTPPNVVLVHGSTRSKLDSFYNFHLDSKSEGNANIRRSRNTINSSNNGGGGGGGVVQQYSDTSPATSISFGGMNARSRYLCVSDEGGAVSIWDMKKSARVRCFRSKIKGHMYYKACMDPTDVYIAALGRTINYNDSMSDATATAAAAAAAAATDVSIHLIKLREGTAAATLQYTSHNTNNASYLPGAECFQYSHLNPNKLMAGSNSGDLLLWDVSSSSLSSPNSKRNGRRASGNGINTSPKSTTSIQPFQIMTRIHDAPIYDVAFSPTNELLIATCSEDETIAFHDVRSKKCIQVISPLMDFSFFKSSNTGSMNGGGGMSSGASACSGRSSDLGGGVTCLSFESGGMSVAAGTKAGIVYHYDLRKSAGGPVSTMDMSLYDKTSYEVTRVHFLPSTIPKSSTKMKQKASLLTKSGSISTLEQHEQSIPSAPSDGDRTQMTHNITLGKRHAHHATSVTTKTTANSSINSSQPEQRLIHSSSGRNNNQMMVHEEEEEEEETSTAAESNYYPSSVYPMSTAGYSAISVDSDLVSTYPSDKSLESSSTKHESSRNRSNGQDYHYPEQETSPHSHHNHPTSQYHHHHHHDAAPQEQYGDHDTLTAISYGKTQASTTALSYSTGSQLASPINTTTANGTRLPVGEEEEEGSENYADENNPSNGNLMKNQRESDFYPVGGRRQHQEQQKQQADGTKSYFQPIKNPVDVRGTSASISMNRTINTNITTGGGGGGGVIHHPDQDKENTPRSSSFGGGGGFSGGVNNTSMSSRRYSTDDELLAGHDNNDHDGHDENDVENMMNNMDSLIERMQMREDTKPEESFDSEQSPKPLLQNSYRSYEDTPRKSNGGGEGDTSFESQASSAIVQGNNSAGAGRYQNSSRVNYRRISGEKSLASIVLTPARKERPSYQMTQGGVTSPSPSRKSFISVEEVNDIVEDAVEALRDDMEEAIRNVQCDFLRKIQRQAEEFKAMLDDQRVEIEDLVNENAMLRAQNSNLQRN